MRPEIISTTPRRILDRLAFLGVGLLLCFSGAAQAALYIKFTGIDGEASERDHKSWSELTDVNWGVSYEVPPSRKLTFKDLSWSQQLDKSFPKLFAAIVAGKPLHDATVDFTTIFGDESPVYFQMMFRDAQLTSLNLNGYGSGDADFSGSFAYSWIRMEYTEFDARGRKIGVVSAEYDLKKALGVADLTALLQVYELGMSGPPVLAVPEPSTYAMMLGGIAAFGLVARRRKSA